MKLKSIFNSLKILSQTFCRQVDFSTSELLTSELSTSELPTGELPSSELSRVRVRVSGDSLSLNKKGGEHH
jgi:hypothetical protein